MTWVRRATSDPHACQPPTHGGYALTPMGRLGDLWRCDDCGALWRIGDACDLCDWAGEWRAHDGGHALGVTWRPATLWQRIRYWKKERA